MKVLEFLLKYKDLIEIFSDLIFMVFTFIIGFKGLDTISKYQNKKEVDLEYQHEFDLIKETNQQIHEFISIVSKSQSLFKMFHTKYMNFEGALDTVEYNNLKDRFNQLENSYIKLEQVLLNNYLLDSELIEVGKLYSFALSEYLFEYSKIFEYLEKNNVVPSEIDLNDKYFKDLTIFYDDTADVIFNFFNRIEEIKAKL